MSDTENEKDREEKEQESSNESEFIQTPTPKEDDEILIELDATNVSDQAITDIVKEENQEDSNDAAEEELSIESSEEIAPPIIEASKKTASSKHKKHHHAKKKKTSAKKTKEPKPVREKNPQRTKNIVIIASVLLLIGATAFMILTKPDLFDNLTALFSKEPALVEDTSIQEDSEIAEEFVVEEHAQTEAYISSKEINNEQETQTEIIPEEIVIETITEALLEQVQTTPQEKPVVAQTPAREKPVMFDKETWIISYASFGSNQNALTSVRRLRDEGHAAGYYWMPDYTPGAAQLFKVYIGPFRTQAQAEAYIIEVKQTVPDAFVMTVGEKK